MRKKHVLGLAAAALVLTTLVAAAPPKPPHRVYGEIDDSDGPVDDIKVEFKYSGSVVASNTTNTTGHYDITIPYNSTYDGSALDFYLAGSDTDEDVVFEPGGSERLDYSGTNIVQEPFVITGTITKNGNAAEGVNASIKHDGSLVGSDSTDSNGDYTVSVPFDDSYDGEKITLYADGEDTNQTVTFKTRGSATIDYDITTDTGNTTTTDDGTDSSSGGGTTTDENDTSTDTSDNDTASDSDTSSGNASFDITDVQVTPDTVKLNEDATIIVSVTNTGDAAGDYTVELEVGGETLTKTIKDIQPGETKTAELKKSFDSAKRYLVDVAGEKADIQVEESGSTKKGGGILASPFFIPAVLVVLAVLAAIFYRSMQSGGSEGGGSGGEESGGFTESMVSEEEESGGSGEEDEFDWKYAED
ncbi:MAG: CARDB domain-containing protein [Candidatus Nanohaloarchaea archaeon]